MPGTQFFDLRGKTEEKRHNLATEASSRRQRDIENRSTDIESRRVSAYDRSVSGIEDKTRLDTMFKVYEAYKKVPQDQQPAARQLFSRIFLTNGDPQMAAWVDQLPTVVTTQEKWAPGSMSEALDYDTKSSQAKSFGYAKGEADYYKSALGNKETPTRAPIDMSQLLSVVGKGLDVAGKWSPSTVAATLADRIKGGEALKRRRPERVD